MKFKTVCSCVHAFIRGLFLGTKERTNAKN